VADDQGGRAAPPPGPGPGGGGKKIAGMPRSYVIIGLAAVVAGVGWFWWRNRKAAQAAAATTGTAGTATAPGPCYDGAGNVVDCADPSAVTGPNASTFQSEIQDLQGELAKAQAAAAQQATGQQTTTGEQETDVSQLTAEDARLQKELAALQAAETKEGKKGPKPKPRPRPRPHTTPMQLAHHQRAHTMPMKAA
jgi:hypothetical protein